MNFQIFFSTYKDAVLLSCFDYKISVTKPHNVKRVMITVGNSSNSH